MRKTLHYEITKEAIQKEPRVLDTLSVVQKNIVDLFYIRGLDYPQIAHTMMVDEASIKRALESAKRKIYVRGLSLISKNKEELLSVQPSRIWDGDHEMIRFITGWSDVGALMNRLIDSPDSSVRDLAVRGIFDFVKTHRSALQKILDHPYTQ